jgi:hypothetical protein
MLLDDGFDVSFDVASLLPVSFSVAGALGVLSMVFDGVSVVRGVAIC